MSWRHQMNNQTVVPFLLNRATLHLMSLRNECWKTQTYRYQLPSQKAVSVFFSCDSLVTTWKFMAGCPLFFIYWRSFEMKKGPTCKCSLEPRAALMCFGGGKRDPDECLHAVKGHDKSVLFLGCPPQWNRDITLGREHSLTDQYNQHGIICTALGTSSSALMKSCGSRL